MKYCTKCGSQMNDGDLYCPKCGAKVDSNPFDSTFGPFYQNPTPTGKSDPSNPPAGISKVLGILSIVFSILGGILGLIFGIICIVTDKEGKDKKYGYIGIGIFLFWIVLFILFIVLGLVGFKFNRG